jgi:hypothetical protein
MKHCIKIATSLQLEQNYETLSISKKELNCQRTGFFLKVQFWNTSEAKCNLNRKGTKARPFQLF